MRTGCKVGFIDITTEATAREFDWCFFEIINRFDNDMLISRISSRVHIVAKAIHINYSSARVLSMWKFTEDWRVKFAIFHEKHFNSVSVSFLSNPYCLGSSYVLLPVSCSVSCLEHLTSRIVLSLPSSQHSGSIVRSAKCRYLSYSVSNFGVFYPTRATRCTDGGEIWHDKFHPIGATVMA